MEKLLKKITNYIDHIIDYNRLYLSIHFTESIIDRFEPDAIDALTPYIAHNNPYCRFVRADVERHKCCMKNQREIIAELCGKERLIHTCYTSVKEITYPIRLEGQVVGFATVSGYKGEGGVILDEILWNTALSAEDIPVRMTDALVPPLCFMLENLIEAQDHKSSTEQNRMIAYVSENFAAMTLDSLSAYLGRSRSYISHLFKKTTGKSLRAYCNELKLFTSEKLLRSTEMTVTEIAFESGFEDTSYFVSIFKDKYGMTPYKYRKSHLTEFN